MTHPKDIPPITEKQAARFWARVDRSHGSDECWPWTGFRLEAGYGKFWIKDRNVLAHRVAWTLTNGPIPDGLNVLHGCDNPSCCNPSHFWLGTLGENAGDRHAKGRDASGERHGKYTKPESRLRGERNGRARLTSEHVRQIRERYASGRESQDALARAFGVWQTTISRIVRGETW